MLRVFILFLLVPVFFSCNKKEVPAVAVYHKPDTIRPGAYFPVYPGSWWIYRASDTISSRIDTFFTLPTYQPTTYCLANTQPGSCTAHSDTLFVPVYISKGFIVSGPIYGYKQWSKNQFVYDMRIRIEAFLSEKEGSCHIRPQYTVWDARNGCHFCSEEVYTFIEKVKVGNDSILKVKGRFLNGGEITVNNQYPNQVTYTEYTKNIGLTKKFKYDTLSMDTLEKLEILNYYINK